MNGYANRESNNMVILCQVFFCIKKYVTDTKIKGASTIENTYSYNMKVSRVELYITQSA